MIGCAQTININKSMNTPFVKSVTDASGNVVLQNTCTGAGPTLGIALNNFIHCVQVELSKLL